MIIPGILEPTFKKVAEKIKTVDEISTIIQIDIADNKLVNGKTFREVEKLRGLNAKSDLTVHLMVKNPAKFLKRNRKFFLLSASKISGVSTVITQLLDEATIKNFITFAKKLGYKVGISINIDQNNSLLDQYINDIDLVQFMAIVPGKQGNDFLPQVLPKITEFKRDFPSVTTQIDGGVNENTLPQILKTGVDNIVVGSAIFNSESPKEKYLEFSKAAYGSSVNS